MLHRWNTQSYTVEGEVARFDLLSVELLAMFSFIYIYIYLYIIIREFLYWKIKCPTKVSVANSGSNQYEL